MDVLMFYDTRRIYYGPEDLSVNIGWFMPMLMIFVATFFLSHLT